MKEKRKKPGDKGREWEKERRDKLNIGFHELCKLLPDHDPSINMSKIEILRKATEYIKQLQEKNDEIIKCGNSNYLKLETERLKKRVAYLILKTTELVDALRKAGVPIPSKTKKKTGKGKVCEKTSSLNQQNSDPTAANKVGDSCKTGNNKKKVVRCGCEKKLKLNKTPLTEANTLVSADVSGTSPSVPTCLSNSVSEIHKDVVPNGVCINTNATTDINNSVDKSSTTQVVTKTSVTQNSVTHITSSNATIQASASPLIQTSVNLIKPPQTLNVNKKELSKLGPGTLIFADGRIVNVPPVIPQIVVKPPPAAPPPAVILMQTPDIALSKPIVKIATTSDEKKEILIAPKKREITMTTFVNKVPIPAVKAFRLEPCPKEPKKRKPTKDQKKNQTSENKTTSDSSTPVSNIETPTVAVTTESISTKRKTQDTLKASNKPLKENSTSIAKGTPTNSGSHSEKDDRVQRVSYSIDGLFNKEDKNEKELCESSTTIDNSMTESGGVLPPVPEANKTIVEVPVASEKSLTTDPNAEINFSKTNENVNNVDAERFDSFMSNTSTEECVSSASSTASTVTPIITPPVSSNPANSTGVSTSDTQKTSATSDISNINNQPTLSTCATENIKKTNDVINKSCTRQLSNPNGTVNSLESREIVNSKPIESSSTPISNIATINDNAKKSLCSSTSGNQEKLTNSNVSSNVITPSCSGNLMSYPFSSSPKANSISTEISSTATTNSANINVSISTKSSANVHPEQTPVSNKNTIAGVNEAKVSVSSNINQLPRTADTLPINSSYNIHNSNIISNCNIKNSNIYAGASNNYKTNSNSVLNSSNVISSYNMSPNLKTASSYNMADVFSNTNNIRENSSTKNVKQNNANTVKCCVNTFNMPPVNSNTSNTYSKTFVPYSVSDVLASSPQITHRGTTNFSISDTDPFCIPATLSKHNAMYSINSTYTSSSITQVKTSRYQKNDLFTSISSMTYKSPSNFSTSDINNVSLSSKPSSVFNTNDITTSNCVSTVSRTSTFTMPDVFTTYSTPLCSSKTSSSFSVPGVFPTTHPPSALSKSSHMFTMADLYSSSNSKPSHLFTMSDITSNILNSSVTFTSGNNNTLDRVSKSCEQVPPTVSSVSEHNHLYDSQHKLPAVSMINSTRNQYSSDKDKLYTASSINNNYKSDHCNDYLRSSKDIDKGFMPVMDEVRLTSDFSNDLFSSLQVPSGGHHSESISPTAAFLLAFPLVSTSKNSENLVDAENNENHTSTPTTILQIGNIEPPSTELFHSMDFAKNKDFEVQTDLDCNKAKQKSKHKTASATVNQSSYSCYPIFPNDYNHQCDFTWSSKSTEKKKQDKVQKYQYDCYKQDRKKRKISVNWMTTPENDLYKESEFPASSGHYNLDMETFSDMCNNKKNHGNYSWSPSKSLLPLDNPLMIPSTLPTLVGDLALGTTTPSDSFKRCDKKDKQEEKKFAQPKSQSANFLSVSQLVDPKCKKQKPSQTERHYSKQKPVASTSASNDKKRQCMGPSTAHPQRSATGDYQQSSSSSSSSAAKRKEPNEPCMYPDNFVPHFNWDNKHRYKGGNYSAESLIQQDATGASACDTFNFNYQQNNFFQSSEFGHDQGQPGCGQYQNFLNFPQGHFPSCVSEEYPSENFTLASQANNRMTVPPPIGPDLVAAAPGGTSERSRTMNQQPIRDSQIRDENTGAYLCAPPTSASFHHYSHHHNRNHHHHHHNHHQQQQQQPQPSQQQQQQQQQQPQPPQPQQQQQSQPPPQQQHSQHQHSTAYSSTNIHHNFSSVGGSGSGPPPPPAPLPPPVSNYSVSTTTTLANFNLSTIFPEINDQRIGTGSMSSTFSNNQTYRGHINV